MLRNKHKKKANSAETLLAFRNREMFYLTRREHFVTKILFQTKVKYEWLLTLPKRALCVNSFYHRLVKEVPYVQRRSRIRNYLC